MATKITKSTIVKSKPTTTSAPKVSRARKSDTVVSGEIITREQIASRAYEHFVERGYDHGHDLEDWLAAERELTPTT